MEETTVISFYVNGQFHFALETSNIVKKYELKAIFFICINYRTFVVLIKTVELLYS